MRRNGLLSYVDGGNSKSIEMYVDEITQPQTLAGSSAQSRYTRHYYPQSHYPGDITIAGICKSQEEYQTLALFIRTHQRALLDTPSNILFTHVNNNIGNQRLLTLSIPTENILVKGFIKRITLSKKGIFEPAPKFTFDFTVVFDTQSTDIKISLALKSNPKSKLPFSPTSVTKIPTSGDN